MTGGRSAPDPARPPATTPGAHRPRGAPAVRSWSDRVDDPAEPLYTMAIAADLLGLDVQNLRRLGAAVDHQGARPSGNQRRYSRNDLGVLARARDLASQGHNASGISRIMELERQVSDLSSGSDRPAL